MIHTHTHTDQRIILVGSLGGGGVNGNSYDENNNKENNDVAIAFALSSLYC